MIEKVDDSDFEKLLRKFRYLFNEYFLEAIKQPSRPKRVPKPVMSGGE